jgi:hypothetical protein
MHIKAKLKVGMFLTSAILLALSAQSTSAAGPAIYRCGPAGSQWYSQIPCAEDSEQLVVEDHQMFSDSDTVSNTQADAQESASADDDADAKSKAQAFIVQLEKQRSAQLAEIDQKIEVLQSGDTTGAGQDDADSSDMAATLLASLQTTRQSIVTEYDAMIDAARQRANTP